VNTIKHKDKLIAELRDKEYRDAFVSEHIDTGIPFQIRTLREQRRWTQKELANRAGVTQVWISKVENPNHSGFSIKTLLKLASAFDIGLIVRYVPISNLVQWELDLSPESLKAVSFEEDPYFEESTLETGSRKLLEPEPQSTIPVQTNIPLEVGIEVGVSLGLTSTFGVQDITETKKLIPVDFANRRKPIDNTMIGRQKPTGNNIVQKLRAGQGQ